MVWTSRLHSTICLIQWAVAVLLLGSHDSSEEPQKFHGSNSSLEIYGSEPIFKPQNKALGCLGWLKYNEGLSHTFIAYDSLNHMDLG